MTFHVDEMHKDKQVVRTVVKGVHTEDFFAGKKTHEYTAKGDPDSKHFYDLLVGREFTFHVTDGGKTRLTAGMDAFSKTMQDHRETAENWQSALALKLSRPNVYLPQKPVAVGDTWNVKRTLSVLPEGYLGMRVRAVESVEAKLTSVKKTQRGQIAYVVLVGQVSQGGLHKFELRGSLEVDLGKNTLLKLHITLTDQKASPANGDPLYRFVIDVHPPARLPDDSDAESPKSKKTNGQKTRQARS